MSIYDTISKLNKVLGQSVNRNQKEIDRLMKQIIGYIAYLESHTGHEKVVDSYENDIQKLLAAMVILGQDQADIDAVFRMNIDQLEKCVQLNFSPKNLFILPYLYIVEKENIEKESEDKAWERWKEQNQELYQKAVTAWKKRGKK